LILLADLLAGFPEDGRFHDWQYCTVPGGANNKLYHVSGPSGTFAFKFTIRDARRRAWREYHACLACRDAGLTLAPRPVLLVEERYSQPLVVLSWETGAVDAAPPASAAEWEELLALFVQTHQITPERFMQNLAPAVINFPAPAAAWKDIQRQLASIPSSSQTKAFTQLLQRTVDYVAAAAAIPPAPVALCHVDANSLNMLRRPGGWGWVDWENSGWGDPAFEIVDLMTHPRYEEVMASRWEWVMVRYATLRGDETAVARIRAVYPVMLTWWAVRLARMLAEWEDGRDQRLVSPPPGWQADLRAKLDRYTARAHAALER
jgi:aminoglycoside phosphotransferase (APT) family kinase protein